MSVNMLQLRPTGPTPIKVLDMASANILRLARTTYYRHMLGVSIAIDYPQRAAGAYPQFRIR